MAHTVVAIKAVYKDGTVTLTPMTRSDRGTRVLLPGVAVFPLLRKNTEMKAAIESALTEILPKRG